MQENSPKPLFLEFVCNRSQTLLVIRKKGVLQLWKMCGLEECTPASNDGYTSLWQTSLSQAEPRNPVHGHESTTKRYEHQVREGARIKEICGP